MLFGFLHDAIFGGLDGDEKGELERLMRSLRGLKVAEVELEGKRYRIRTRLDGGRYWRI